MKSYFIVILIVYLSITPHVFGQDTFLDNFEIPSYSNNNGTQSFSGNWIESGDDNNASGGRIQINGGDFTFINLDNASVGRTLDLSGASLVILTLEYDATARGGEELDIQLWNATSLNWETVATLDSNTTGNISHTLTADQVSSTSEIRFINGLNGWGNTDTILVDNVLFTSYSGSTSCTTLSSSPAMAIPDDGTTLTQNLSGFAMGLITDVNVTLNIDHPWTGDLDIFLQSPTGTIVELSTDNVENASVDGFVNTVFDDAAANPITLGSPPFTGVFRPEGSLGSFNGEDASGTWVLRITDDFSFADAGTLNNFSIEVCTLVLGPMIQIDDVSVDEGAGSMLFTVTHTGADASGSFSVPYSIIAGTASEGIDYTTSSGLYTGTLNFNGTSGDTEQIVVQITDDFDFEGSETYTIQFGAATDSAVNTTDTATGTIQDNDNDPNATRTYEERRAINLSGNFKMFGNTNLECVSGCPATPTSNNPPAVMGYIDVDSDGTTVNSSSSNLNLPVGATVEWAGLYWGGLYNSTNSGIVNPSGTLDIDQVKLMDPVSGIYTTINSEVRNIETATFAGWNTFMSYADVTGIVQTGGNGDYFVADIALSTGSSFTGPYGGWTMVVIYSDPAEIDRNISVWDGFDFFGFGANDSFTVTGLLTPSSGSFESTIGYFGFDGEASSNGDFVSIEGTPLSNALNPPTNTLNGTISEFGVDVGNRNPNFGYSWGIDIDVFDATGLVGNGATEMDVVLGSSIEGIWGGVFVASNEIAFPSVASKSFSPTLISQGDESRVTITVDNPSNGVDLTNFSLTDNLPTGMVIASTPDATSSSGGTISAVSGSNTFTVSGLSILSGATCVFSFDVETLSIGDYQNTIYPTDTNNDQNIPFSGEYTGTLSVRPGTVITNRRITYRVNKN